MSSSAPHAELCVCRPKRWHLTLGKALKELTLFWNFLAVAVVRAEDDSLLFVHGSKADLEELHQALAFVNGLPHSKAGERPTFRIMVCRT